jgi:hypothetical protein
MSGGGSGASTPPGGSSGDIQYNNGSGGFGGSATTITSGGSVTILSGQLISWNGDTGLSRDAAGILDLGNGTQGGKTGQLNLTTLNALTGIQINGAATSGAYLRGDGTNFVSSVLQATDFPVLNGQDLGYLFSNGSVNASVNVTSSSVLALNANETWVYQFVLPCALTLGKVSYSSGSATVASTFASFGIFNASGNLQCQGTFDTSMSASTPRTVNFTRVTLPPGVYYFAWTTNNATINSSSTFSETNTTVSTFLNKWATLKRVGTATASSGGVLNSTMGTVTAATLPNQAIPAVIFEYN